MDNNIEDLLIRLEFDSTIEKLLICLCNRNICLKSNMTARQPF